MTALDFLSPAACAPEVTLVSPLSSALTGGAGGMVDVSALGKLDVRGDVGRLELGPGEELIPIAPERALLVTRNVLASRNRLTEAGFRAYDMTASFAAFEVTGERLLRRLTALDLEQLPAVGAILRETPAVIQRVEGERFRFLVPQELGHAVATAVLDLVAALA